jgi:hypothetical protein
VEHVERAKEGVVSDLIAAAADDIDTATKLRAALNVPATT